MKIKTDFLKVGRQDVSLLKEKVIAIPEEEWAAYDARQQRFAVHQDTQTIHGQKLRPDGFCNQLVCAPTDMARRPCDCHEN